MLKKLIATAAVLTIVASASATITAWHELHQAGTLTTGDSYESFRFYVQVSGDDDWTAAGIDVELTGATFYQNALGGNPVNPALFGFDPDLEWDTYYSSPDTYPSDAYDSTAVGVASTLDTATVLNTDWFDTLTTGDGTFVIAQVTVLNPDPGYVGPGLLQYAAADTGGTLFDYVFELPEPASLTLLALGGLALIRRR